MAERERDRKKFLFLPTAHNYSSEKPETWVQPQFPPEPDPAAGEYPCPCCGYLTFPVPREEALAYICPVCYWENDVFDPGEDDPSDENGGMTLRQGREAFKKYGAVQPGLVKHVRPPLPAERPDERSE